jgi:hypothetical protein
LKKPIIIDPDLLNVGISNKDQHMYPPILAGLAINGTDAVNKFESMTGIFMPLNLNSAVQNWKGYIPIAGQVKSKLHISSSYKYIKPKTPQKASQKSKLKDLADYLKSDE